MRAMTWVTAVACAASWSAAAGPAAADGNPWARARTPAEGPPRAIGGYSAGCVAGAARLPTRGAGFVVLRPERRRFFGHPVLVSFIEELGALAKKEKLGTLAVGDLGQPRGGPAPSGHASHQTGLDVDLYYRLPDRGEPPSMVDLDAQAMSAHWSPKVARLVEAAARDRRVARIFVNPVIKQALCEGAGKERQWLQKLRPWWGHHTHFHVRLACPDDSPDCESQAPLPDGDGCGDDLAWWFRDDTQAERKRKRSSYRKRVGGLPDLPAKCAELVE